MNFKFKYFLLLVVFWPLAASAHGLVTSQNQVVGNYKIEFEYNTLGSIFTGDYTIYDTYLLNPTNNQPLDFDTAFIRIQKKNGPAVMAGSLSESQDIRGYASLSGVINDPGTYTAEVDFYQFGKQLASSQFDFNVKAPDLNLNPASPSSKNNLVWPIAAFILGLAVGSAGMIWNKFRKKN